MQFTVGVKAVLVRDGRVLVLRKAQEFGGYLDVPGGRVDPDEDALQALSRELAEEIGVRSGVIGDPVYAAPLPDVTVEGAPLWLTFFRVELHEDIRLGDEHEEHMWLTAAEVAAFAAAGEMHAVHAHALTVALGEAREGKLVRDRIPQIIRADGQEPDVHRAAPSEHLSLLEDKLDEEAGEFHTAHNLEELADLAEVLHALAEALGYTPQELEALRRAKACERGGFSEGWVLDRRA